MLFDLCVTFIYWMCAFNGRASHVMSVFAAFKMAYKCALVLSRREWLDEKLFRQCVATEWRFSLIDERQSFGLRDAIFIRMNITKRMPNVFATTAATTTTTT